MNLLKELSEKESNYINKEKEYFKILTKLHDVTKQIRNYDHESQEDINSKSKNKNNNKKENNEGEKKEEEEGKEEEDNEKSIIIHPVKPENNKNSKEELKEEKNKNKSRKKRNRKNKNDKNNDNNNNDNDNDNDNDNNNDNNDNDNTSNNNKNEDTTIHKGIRQKYSYQHLLHYQQKLKKEFLRHFNDNQKQLDTIYHIKELKIPSTLYKLIQESSKMWTKFLSTYRKLEASLQKLQQSSESETEDDTTINNKTSIHKLNLNFDEHEQGIKTINYT